MISHDAPLLIPGKGRLIIKQFQAADLRFRGIWVGYGKYWHFVKLFLIDFLFFLGKFGNFFLKDSGIKINSIKPK